MIGKELSILNNLDSLIYTLLKVECDDAIRDHYTNLGIFVQEFYVYHLKLIIYQYDLQPITKAKKSIYFKFDGYYLALHESDTINMDLSLSNIDFRLVIQHDRFEEIDKIKEMLKQKGYIQVIDILYRSIDFDKILYFMLDNVAGNDEVAETLNAYNKKAKVLAQNMR